MNLSVLGGVLAGTSAQGLEIGLAGSQPTVVALAAAQPSAPRMPPPAQRPGPGSTGLTLMATAALLVLAVLWVERHHLRPRQRRAQASSLLPQPRLGATHHERLHDAGYLDGMLKTELRDASSREEPARQQPARQPESPSNNPPDQPLRPDQP